MMIYVLYDHCDMSQCVEALAVAVAVTTCCHRLHRVKYERCEKRNKERIGYDVDNMKDPLRKTETYQGNYTDSNREVKTRMITQLFKIILSI